MSSEAISFLQKQDRDSKTDDGFEDEDLIVHENELLSHRHNSAAKTRLLLLFLGRFYRWFNHVVFGGNFLVLLWILWGVVTVRSYCPDAPFCMLPQPQCLTELLESKAYEATPLM